MAGLTLSFFLAVLLALGVGTLLFAVGLMVAGDTAGRGADQPARSLSKVANKNSLLHSSLLRLLGENDAKRQEALRRRLFQAGFTGPQTPYLFALSKLGTGGVGIVVMGAVLATFPAFQAGGPLQWLTFFVLAFIIGFSLPGVLVSSWAQRYVDRIAKGLPDALDLMLVCVEAGQSLDMSLVRVSRLMRDLHPELAERFSATADALKAGEDRASAFERLATETENPDLEAFARVVLQSSAMGTPVADTFRVFAAELRTRRMRRIEEQANVLPTKMTLGTMLFTVPPFLLLMLAPAVYTILTSF